MPLRDAPDEAVELIKSFEGIPDGDPSTVNIDAYLCPAGIWTIGWGHAIVHDGQQLKGAGSKALARSLYPGGITREQAVTLLRADLLAFCSRVERLLKVPVDDRQFGALLAFAFNVGAGALGDSTLLRKLNAGDVAGAAEQFLVWDKARVNGVLQPLAGLTRRRRAERALFLDEDWRAVAGVSATRSRGRGGAPAEALLPLPVPEPPDDQAAPTPVKARRSAAVKPVAKKTPGPKKASAQGTAATAAKGPTKAPAKASPKAARPSAKATATPRARTTRPTGLPPAPPAKRPPRQKAR